MVVSTKTPLDSILDPKMASQAESLWSRLNRPAAVPLTEKEARRWVERWARLASDDGVDLDRRLIWAGWSRESVEGALTRDGQPAGLEWLWTMADWIERSCQASSLRSRKEGQGEQTILPFEELLLPLASSAVRGLSARSVEAGCRRRMERLLAKRWSELASPGLLSELARRTGRFRGYADFVGQPFLVWRRLFSRRPVLGRLMVLSGRRWREAVQELLERLDLDRPRLRSVFNAGRPLGRLRSIEPAGDEHLGGRAVYVLKFESGLRLVYKPRDLSPESAWGSLLQWLNGRERATPFRETGVLCRDGYGWMEHVPWRPLPSAAAARRYYWNAGALLALVYALGGRDFHFENLIANGRGPVLVDLETILQPQFREAAGSWPSETALDTGLLPRWVCLRPGRPVDLSGLGCIGTQTPGFWKLKFSGVNSDAMKAKRVPWRLEPFGNVPGDGRQVFPPSDFSEAVLRGFESAYREIRALRSRLLASRGPLRRFRRLPIRVLLRNSVSYWETLRRSLHLVPLAHGIARSLVIDRIAAKWAAGAGAPLLWPAAAAEIQALEELDIPIFNTAAESRDLALPCGGVVAGCFRLSAVENAEQRLGRMGDSDLKTQLKAIDGSLRLHRLARREGRRLGPLLAWALQNQEPPPPQQ